MFVFSVISHGIVQGTDILPHKNVALRPVMDKSVFGLKLMGEKRLQQLLTFLLGNIVNAHRVSMISVEHIAFCDRMLQEYGMGYGRSFAGVAPGSAPAACFPFHGASFPKIC